MRTQGNRLNPLAWPLWIKFLVGFGLAFIVPLILILVALQPILRDAGLQNLTAFINENGDRQRLSLAREIEAANTELANFAAEPSNYRIITTLLLRDSPLLNASQETEDALNATADLILDEALLGTADGRFVAAYLLDPNGGLVASASLENATFDPQQTNRSDSATYLSIVSEQLKAQPRPVIFSITERADLPIAEVASAIQWRDGRPIGYLIAELNNERVLYNQMQFEDNTQSAYSYLLTSSGLIIQPPRIDRIVPDIGSVGAERALLGETGAAVYRLPASDTQIVGYHAPISNTPLFLVSEIPADNAVTQSQSFFDTRFFVISVAMIAFILILAALFNQIIAPPLNRLRRAVSAVTEGDFGEPINITNRGDEIGQLTASFGTMREQIQSLIGDLEARVAARTRDISTTQEISRYAANQRDIQILMDQVVDLIVDRFDSIYHAQIFLIDSNQENAVLRASTGEAGQRLLELNHRLAVGSVSVIGQVSERAELVIARDTSVSQVHRRNEFLPETRAELAIPLTIGDQVIGALDVQSKQSEAFGEDQVIVLSTMADQIAIAIQNARLYQESLRRLREIERSNQIATMRAWQDYMRDQRTYDMHSEAGTPSATTDAMSALHQQAFEQGQVVVGDPTEHATVPIAVPIKLREQVLGVVEWELNTSDINANRLQLAQELANRLAFSLENARLFQNSQSLAERERVVSDIAAKLTAQTDIDEILQTAVREVGQALRAPQVSIRLGNRDNGNNGHPTNNAS
jgi:GAF domain-containing protein/HAMP domain-containing protein